jgi:two-component system, NtrC family, sensor kinase
MGKRSLFYSVKLRIPASGWAFIVPAMAAVTFVMLFVALPWDGVEGSVAAQSVCVTNPERQAELLLGRTLDTSAALMCFCLLAAAMAMTHMTGRHGAAGRKSRLLRLRRRLAVAQERLREREAELLEARAALDVLRDRLTAVDALAALGQLTAGIAHEIRNPINFVNNFAESTLELLDELSETLGAVQAGANDRQQVETVLGELRSSASRIREHGRRVDGIVRSMLLQVHGKSGVKEIVEINSFLDQYITLAFHGMRAQIPDFSVRIERHFDEGLGAVSIIRQDMARVFINLLNNAFQALSAYRSQAGEAWEPLLRIRTEAASSGCRIVFEDNGGGVAAELRERIFEPFFTTKMADKGTGLGLSLSRQTVVQGHGGTLRYETSALGGAAFIIDIP